jgi:hypothetical protein
MSDSDSDDDELAGITHIITPQEFLTIGLATFFEDKTINRTKQATNVSRFVSYFGSSPSVCATIWEDLQRDSTVDEARVEQDKRKPKYFLMAMHFLKVYDTELRNEGPWKISRKHARKWIFFYLSKVQALKATKITWPLDWGDDVWIVTVDGTHCWINEPTHPDWSQDKEYYSHKYNKAGLNYELGISIASSRLVWMNGPFKAGTNDVSIFQARHGLKEKLQSIGKKGIGDKGYNGHHNDVSTFNALDSRAVKKFKSRALHRHETFNNMTKRFDCLSGRFRHGVNQFASCFEAICVICQYQLEADMPLYDVLIEDIID